MNYCMLGAELASLRCLIRNRQANFAIVESIPVHSIISHKTDLAKKLPLDGHFNAPTLTGNMNMLAYKTLKEVER